MGENTIKIGDSVKVVNNGKQYSTSDNWAKSIGLPNYARNKNIANGTVGVITWVGKVPNNEIDAVSVNYEGADYLLGTLGVELVESKVDTGMDLIGKCIISSVNHSYKIMAYNCIRDTLFMQCIDKNNIAAKNVSPKKVRQNLECKVWKFTNDGSETILEKWAEAFDSNIKLRNAFFELWEGKKSILSSDIYRVVKLTQHGRCGSLYDRIKRDCSTPLASMNAQLILHYEDVLLSEKLGLSIGLGRTQPLVRIVEEYCKKLEKCMVIKDAIPEPENFVGNIVLTYNKSRGTVVKHTNTKVHMKWDNGVGSEIWDIEEFNENINDCWSWEISPVPKFDFDKTYTRNGATFKIIASTSDKTLYVKKFINKADDHEGSYYTEKQINKYVKDGRWKNYSDGTELLGKKIRNIDNGSVADVIKVVPGVSVTYEWENRGNKYTRHLKEMFDLLDSSSWEILKPSTAINTPIGTTVKMYKETPDCLIENKHSKTATKVVHGLIFETSAKNPLIITIIDSITCRISDMEGKESSKWIISKVQEMFDKGKWTAIPLQNLKENKQWQHYNAQTENYTTQPEEETIMSNKVSFTTTVATKPYQVIPACAVFYNQKVKDMDESDLFRTLKLIESEQKTLEDLNTGDDCDRITKQLKVLKEARKHVYTALDSLPKDGDDE